MIDLHSSFQVHALYGFQRECTQKYDQEIYEQFNAVFENLPLATLLNDKVLVLHGGVDDELSLKENTYPPPPHLP